MSVEVDHAVINVMTRMDAAVERFSSLGFTLTERGFHSLGSINHLMMFGTDYLELVGIEPEAKKVRREVADGPVGLNGLVIRTQDARALHATLAASAIPVLDAVDFDRPVAFEGRMQRAEFTTVRIDPGWLSGGRVYFCEHRTPQLVWQPQWQHHDNGAVGLAAFTIVVPDPADEGGRYARLLGCKPKMRRSDEVELDLGRFQLVLCTQARYLERYGDCASSRVNSAEAAFMGALSVRVASMRRVRDCLARPAAADVRWRTSGDPRHAVGGDDAGVTIAASSAYDCALDFVA